MFDEVPVDTHVCGLLLMITVVAGKEEHLVLLVFFRIQHVVAESMINNCIFVY